MKSNVIMIDNQGHGYDRVEAEAAKVAAYTELSHKNGLQLQLIAEEMLSLARSVTGEMSASFWIENEGHRFDLHLTTNAELDREKRELLISSATSRKNEAAGSFLGKVREFFESAMTTEPNHNHDLPEELLDDVVNHVIVCDDPEWDGYEQSTLRRLADTIRVGIRGNRVDMQVEKTFA